MSQADRTATNVEPLFHPVSHYDSPADVLSDAKFSTDEKRVILSSWASEMYVVESHPSLSRGPGYPAQIASGRHSGCAEAIGHRHRSAGTRRIGHEAASQA
jgi:hypothetical protein